jgi:hypothetical protein
MGRTFRAKMRWAEHLGSMGNKIRRLGLKTYIQMILMKQIGGIWTGFFWLRIDTSNRLFQPLKQIFRFHKTHEIS